MTPTTLLEAVNVMLSTIGSAPCAQLETDNMEVVMAQSILNDVLRDIQVKGWNFNREEDYPLTPNVAGGIELPINCIKVERIEGEPDLVVRGPQLYDRKLHTYRIRRPVKATLVMSLPFKDTPEAFRRYVLIRAARIFSDRILGSSALHSFTESDELAALSQLRNAENEITNPNILRGNGYFHSLLER